MTSRPSDLPDFAKPPVVEVVLALQFRSLSSLTTAHVGLLWQRYRERLPLIEEHAPLRHTSETFGRPSPPQVEVTFEDNRPPRASGS